MRALVTGATGFVGTHLVGYLRANTDWEVYGVARKSAAGSTGGSHGERICYAAADLLNPAQIHHLVSEIRP
ncbi:MAG: NAD-dependent epimerase/dehydratase family protein, partial [Chloroflexi bacterium]|nr:NAD-dependent epimerase/dehydratase family protein [Chloroflexota bacterium]